MASITSYQSPDPLYPPIPHPTPHDGPHYSVRTPSARAPAPSLPLKNAAINTRSVLVRFKEDDRSEAELKRAGDKMRGANDAASDAKDAARRAAGNLGDAGKAAAEGLKDQTRETLTDATRAAQDKASDLKTRVQESAQKQAQQVSVTQADVPNLLRRGYYSTTFPAFIPVFSRQREVWVGRIAMLGFAATCAMEAFSPGHLGPIMQVRQLTGFSAEDVVRALGYLVAFNTYAFLPFSPTFTPANLQDLDKRPAGPGLIKPALYGFDRLADNLGISSWGFTKRNELFQGRLAMLAFAWTLWGELNTGLGPIAQLFRNLGQPLNEEMYGTAGRFFYGGLFVVLALSYAWGSRYQTQAEKEIY